MQVQFRLNFVAFFVRIVLPTAVLGLCVAAVLLINALVYQSPVRASHGQLDLRGWQFDQGPVLLAGDWAFHWNTYIAPDEIARKHWQAAPAYITLPGVWNGIEYQGTSLPVLGMASMVLHLRLLPERDYLLRVPTLTNRIRIWVNEQALLVDDLEQPRVTHREVSSPRLLAFNSGSGDAVVLIHLVNDRHRAGGIWEPLLLSETQYQVDLVTGGRLADILSAFGLSLASVFIVLLAIRDRRWTLLFLALFSAVMAVRAGTVNERMLFVLAGIQDWELQQLLEHLTLFASLPFFALYLGYRFPAYFPPLLHWLTAGIMGVLICLVLLTPPSVYSHTITIIKAVAVGYAFLLLGALLEQVRQRQRTAMLLLAGSCLFILATVNDILYTSNIIHSTNLTHVGALAFLLVAVFYRGEFIKRSTLFERLKVEEEQAEQPLPEHPLRESYLSFVETRDEGVLRELTARTMNHVLDAWQSSVGLGKIDFAEQSGLWRVTNDNGTLKTRTLDKYLRAASLPKNPRYKTVAGSLQFVSTKASLPDGEQLWLQRIAELYQQLD